MYSQLNIKSKIQDYSIDIVNSLNYILELYQQNNTFVLIDQNVANHYTSLYNENCIKLNCIESAKTLDGASYIASELINRKCNTYSKLLIIGGGILQDLAGFVASIYARGIEYILIPTTLLSMVDSCIGGKTSINFQHRKNILGTFYPPSRIIIYPEFANSLTKLDYLSGLGEVYKFHILQNKIEQFDQNNDKTSIIYDSLKYKSSIIAIDEFDKKERKFLNFGHTFGHAIESVSNNRIPHGIAVIIGSIIATKVSIKLGYEVPKIDLILSKGMELLQDSRLSFQQQWFDPKALLEFAKSDKKNNGKINMVLLNKSEVCVQPVEDYNIIESAIKETYETI